MRAVREGAQDYLVKGQVTGQLLVRAMRYATERKRAVEALQRSEEYFRSLIENALDIITVVDVDGTVRYGSPSFERVLGYPHAALTGESLFKLIHPEDRDRVHQLLEFGAQNPVRPSPSNSGSWTETGIGVFSRRWASVSKKSPLSWICLQLRDITERKRSEEAVRQANETLRAVFETSPLAIYTFDLEGVVRTWNSNATKCSGMLRRK
jgi:PAS domain S-box-containing protein